MGENCFPARTRCVRTQQAVGPSPVSETTEKLFRGYDIGSTPFHPEKADLEMVETDETLGLDGGHKIHTYSGRCFVCSKPLALATEEMLPEYPCGERDSTPYTLERLLVRR